MDVKFISSIKLKCFFSLFFVKFYTNFNITLINSKGVCRDYLGYCNITKCYNNFKILRQFVISDSVFNKVADFKNRLHNRCFYVNIEKFLKTPFSQHISGRMQM